MKLKLFNSNRSITGAGVATLLIYVILRVGRNVRSQCNDTCLHPYRRSVPPAAHTYFITPTPHILPHIPTSHILHHTHITRTKAPFLLLYFSTLISLGPANAQTLSICSIGPNEVRLPAHMAVGIHPASPHPPYLMVMLILFRTNFKMMRKLLFKQ